MRKEEDGCWIWKTRVGGISVFARYAVIGKVTEGGGHVKPAVCKPRLS